MTTGQGGEGGFLCTVEQNTSTLAHFGHVKCSGVHDINVNIVTIASWELLIAYTCKGQQRLVSI